MESVIKNSNTTNETAETEQEVEEKDMVIKITQWLALQSWGFTGIADYYADGGLRNNQCCLYSDSPHPGSKSFQIWPRKKLVPFLKYIRTISC